MKYLIAAFEQQDQECSQRGIYIAIFVNQMIKQLYTDSLTNGNVLESSMLICSPVEYNYYNIGLASHRLWVGDSQRFLVYLTSTKNLKLNLKHTCKTDGKIDPNSHYFVYYIALKLLLVVLSSTALFTRNSSILEQGIFTAETGCSKSTNTKTKENFPATCLQSYIKESCLDHLYMF